MHSNRNIRLTISFTVLVAAVMLIFFLQQEQANVTIDPMLFRVGDANAIDHVVLESKDKKIDLKYDGRLWKLNGTFEADGQLVKVLMATLLQVTPKQPVARQQKDSIDALLSKAGTKISVYTAEGLEKEFQAGGNNEKTQAWFRDFKSGETYLVTIPGYRVYAAGVFELKESDWREKRIFNFNWRNFRQLTFTYPKEPAASFEVVKEKDLLGIAGMNNPDSTRVNNFLNDVLILSADQIVAPGSSKSYDSLVKTPPVVQMVVSDISKHNYRLDLFGQSPKQTKVVGQAWDGEIVVFDRRKLFPVIKKRNYFKGK